MYYKRKDSVIYVWVITAIIAPQEWCFGGGGNG
jgi:hypothetical protein